MLLGLIAALNICKKSDYETEVKKSKLIILVLLFMNRIDSLIIYLLRLKLKVIVIYINVARVGQT